MQENYSWYITIKQDSLVPTFADETSSSIFNEGENSSKGIYFFAVRSNIVRILFLFDHVNNLIPSFDSADDAVPACTRLYDEQREWINRNPNVQDGPDLPECDADGLFEKIQCNDFTGECWCVESASGTRVNCSGNYQFCFTIAIQIGI